MIAGTYIGSTLVLAALTLLFVGDSLGKRGFMAFLLATFFLASAGTSAAYLTVSEIFPMETRALAIAFFYAIGTAIGGITGPYLFGRMIESGEESRVAIAFFIGAGVMALGGVAEIFFGVKAEKAELEDIAKPLTATDAEQDAARRGGGREPRAVPPQPRPRRGVLGRPPRAGPPLPARPGQGRLLSRHARVGADHRGGVLPRGAEDRAGAGRARPDRAARARQAGRRALLGPGPSRRRCARRC
jgi:hypothetical protein